jgi:plasmid stability protein
MDICSLQIKVNVETRDRLRVQAAIEGVSMSHVANRILTEGLASVNIKGKK